MNEPTMKKILTTILAASLLLLGTQAFAQGSINAGYLNSTQSHQRVDGVNSHGAFLGASYNIDLVAGLGVAPGLYYSLIANRNAEAASFAGITGTSDVRFREHALNVPVYLNWGTDIARDSRFFVYGGPTVQYGLSSKTKQKGTVGIEGVGSLTSDNTVDSYADLNQNRLNVYVGGGLGIVVAGFQVTVGYDYGLMNLYKGDNAEKSNRSNIKIGIGKSF